jgi:hypothetical protein
MKINITKKQYEDLLKLVYLGNWMANANRTEDKMQSMDDLEGYIFSFAKDFGMERWADTDDPKMTYPTSYFEGESGVQELIDDYDNENFWDELADRLGNRDFMDKYSKEEIEAMDREEYFMKNMECTIAWEKEFEKHGIDRLRIVDMKMKTEKEDKKL